jgi:hypothetical protein
VIGSNNYITLLRFSGNQITASRTLSEQGVYANFIFPYDGMLYYQSKSAKAVKAIDLKTWQVTKTYPVDINKEITLVALPE